MRILISVLSFLLLAQDVFAAPVYRSEGDDGRVIYSSKPPSKGAKPAELPPITRAEVKITKSDLLTCGNHGGINCQSGADQDGSVICYDGFRGATARYRFSCNTPKLEITDVSDPTPEGAFTVFVRNARSVKADGTVVTFKAAQGKPLRLQGPSQIDAFGIAEYVLSVHEGGPLPSKPDLATLEVTCANCPA